MPGATVPSAPQEQQQSTAAQGVDIISQLITSAKSADERAAKTAQAATIPISGGHIAPQQVNTPGAGHTYQQFGMDERRVVGKHQANMQGLANLSKSVANVIGQVTQQQDQKKTQALSVNIEHLMTAVASSDQAKQVLAQDPNNADAKAQLAKAEAIQNEVLGDDKNRKAIAKAYNINFTDPSKNNTPEHAAMKQAQDSYAKQFQDKIPTQMAPNQQAIAEAKTAAAEAKATHDLVDKLAPAIITATSRENVEQNRAQSAQAVARTIAEAKFKSAQYTADQHYKAATDGANIHVKGMLQATKMRDDTLLSIAQSKIDQLNGKDGKTPKAQQEAQKSFDSISKVLEKIPITIDLYRQERAKIYTENKHSPKLEFYNRQIAFYESQGSVLQLKQQELANRLSSAGETVIPGEDTPPTKPNATESNPNYKPIVNPNDDPDPDPDDDPNVIGSAAWVQKQ